MEITFYPDSVWFVTIKCGNILNNDRYEPQFDTLVALSLKKETS